MASKEGKPRKDAEPHKQAGGFSRFFGDVANKTSQAAGRASAFMMAAGVVVIWAVTGPLFQYSDTWQLVINTGTTIVTFLMVFLIQNSQNRDSAAIQVKLDELIRVSTAHNSFVGIEHLTDDELEEIRSKCERRAEAEKDRRGLGEANRQESQRSRGARGAIGCVATNALLSRARERPANVTTITSRSRSGARCESERYVRCLTQLKRPEHSPEH